MVKPPRRPRRGRRALKTALLALLFVAAASLSMLAGAYVSVARTLPSLELSDRIPSPETTKIYDSSPEPVLLAELHGLDNRQALTGDQIPQAARDAIVAAEDPRFYERKGMDFFAILRAAWADARHREVPAGGSAITQALIKNAFVTNEQNASDATLEPAIAYALETRWTKEKILDEYLNYVYFGSGAYGIQAAATSYFGVDAKDLSLGQAALLAGLPASPSAYSPRHDQGAALDRRDAVLNKMYQQHYISSEQLLRAMEEPLRLADVSGAKDKDALWVDLIREQLIARYGSSTVMDGGLRVYASFNSATQAAAEKAVQEVLAQIPGRTEGSPKDAPVQPSAALVAIEVRTGRMVAMVGAGPGSDETNLATQTRRQTGPAFLPFVLTAALEQGVSPDASCDTTTPDSPTLSQAIARRASASLAAVVAPIGTPVVAQTAADMGLPAQPAATTPALALDGPAAGVSPLEMAMGYATLASGGERLSARVGFDPSKGGYPISILRVTDAEGKLLDENGVAQTRVVDSGLAEMVTSSLRGALSEISAAAASLGRPAAGIGGPASDGSGAWFVGYTPDLVSAVWVEYPGGAASSSAEASSSSESEFPAKIWAAFMKAALSGTPISQFPEDDIARWATVDVCSESHLLPTDLCPVVVKRLFRVGEAPADTCDVHVPQAVLMPDVVGLTLARARKELADAGLKYRTIVDAESLEPEGTVTRQDQKAGTPVLQGSAVVLHISAGMAVSVPKVVGATAEEAQTRLTAAGLAVTIVKQASKTVAAGMVISVDPQAGTVVKKGSVVTLTISSGSAPPPSSSTTSTT